MAGTNLESSILARVNLRAIGAFLQQCIGNTFLHVATSKYYSYLAVVGSWSTTASTTLSDSRSVHKL